jgi:hypothetical protein
MTRSKKLLLRPPLVVRKIHIFESVNKAHLPIRPLVIIIIIIIMSYYQSLSYQKNCVTQPVIPSLTMGGALTVLDLVQGARFSPQRLGVNVGGLYMYHVLQCPMEAISGGPSALHNIASGGILGYMGVSAGMLGVPLMDGYFFMRNPSISPPLAGAVVYGGIAGIIATVLGGKPF